jgi:hypothetical protein
MLYKSIKKVRKRVKKFLMKRISILISDLKNKIVYGRHAPVYAETIWINPENCKMALFNRDPISGMKGIRVSGQIVHIWPPKENILMVPINDIPKIKYCIDHWSQAIPWEETGMYDYIEMQIDKSSKKSYNKCKNVKDILKRYRKLDRIFMQVKKEGKIRAAKEIDPQAFREEDGILIHIGPSGELYLGGSFHRFAMALVLQLILVPSQIGYVHINAISNLQNIRKNKSMVKHHENHH